MMKRTFEKFSSMNFGSLAMILILAVTFYLRLFLVGTAAGRISTGINA